MPRVFFSALLWLALISRGHASDGTAVKFSITGEKLQIEYTCREVDWERTVFVALKSGAEPGSAVVPFPSLLRGRPSSCPSKPTGES